MNSSDFELRFDFANEKRFMRVLIVEDDAPLASFLAQALCAEHYEVQLCKRYEQVLPGNSDLIVIDFNVSAQEGVRAITAIRCQAPKALLIGLSARRTCKEVAGFLDAGADDYLVKPFSYAELSARIRALRRRSQLAADAVLNIADLNLDRVRRRVERAGRSIDLTAKEFSLLEFLMLNAGRKVSRAEILEHVWNALPSPGSTNLVDVYIAYVRKKVDGASPQKLIQTTRGIGYAIGTSATAPVVSASALNP